MSRTPPAIPETARAADPDPPPATAQRMFGSTQRIAGAAAAFGLLALGLWILQSFLAALAWAAVFAIASWPLYRRLVGAVPHWAQRAAAPLLFTLALGLLFAVPLSFLGLEVARAIHATVGLAAEVRKSGIAVPDWVGRLPLFGPQAAKWWHEYLGDPYAARALLSHIDTATLAEKARELGGEVVHRVTIFFFTLLALFFLLRDGSTLASRMSALNHRLFGRRGDLTAAHMVSAVQGTVYGLVLVGFAEGVLIGIAYLAVGLPNAVPIAALTGVLAVIPFGAPVVFCAAALYLVSAGGLIPAAIVLGVGFTVVFVTDHFVRPILIGGAAHLPFLAVLLGILGGLETFGVLGLFLGPAVIAALVSLWRDATDSPSAAALMGPRRGRGERVRR
jgi:predicted PurR-regulated permease PerM